MFNSRLKPNAKVRHILLKFVHHKNKVKPTKSMKSTKIILIAFFLTLMMSLRHPYYVGVIEINWLVKKKLEVNVKLFTDDLQNAVYDHQKVKFQSIDKSEKNKIALEKYIKSKFNLFQLSPKKSELIPLSFVGWEVEDEATWIYFECNKVKGIKDDNQLIVHSQLLYNVLNKQVTIVHFSKNGIRKSEQIVQPEATIQFNF